MIWVKSGDPCGGENFQPCCFQFRGKGWEISNFFKKIRRLKQWRRCGDLVPFQTII